MIRGKVHKYGANIDTDGIIPARYLHVTDPSVLLKHCASHCMEELDPDFVKTVKPGDIIVATTNFGCGSSRDQAALAIKGSGIACVIANSYGRIFFRNAINAGVPVLECEQLPEETDASDVLEVELATGEIKNVTKGKAYKAKPMPAFILELIAAGGIIEYTRKQLAACKSKSSRTGSA